MTIASGNAASFLPFPVIAPDTFEAIAAAFEAQEPAAFLPPGADATVVAGYQAQKRHQAKQMRSHGSAFYNLFLRGSYQEGAMVLLHTASRGTISVDPRDPVFREPLVDYRALSNPTDIDVVIEFVKFSRRYFLETSLKAYGPVERRPGQNLTTTVELAAAAKANVSPTCFHPVGTAAMMPRELGGVVNEKLQVYGVSGLSVVDASIIPVLPGAYTQQTVFAVAEKVRAVNIRGYSPSPT
jgi:choline dehydrogenase